MYLIFFFKEKLIEFNNKIERKSLKVSKSQIENLLKTCESGANCTVEDIETLNILLEWPQGKNDF